MLPTGTLTFLFTDIESSTQLWEQHLDGMKAALAQHDALLRQAVESNGGHVIKTGEAEAREGDYFGPALNRAARLMSIAYGGQILLSGAAAEMVRDHLPEGAALRDLGEHRLKDLVRPERVFQLLGPGLPDDFPALRSLNALPNNLPVQLTSFIGREQEMAEVKDLLTTTHLLTLTGPGGTGKTRLSLQVAAEVLDVFPDGAWLVELAPLADPALLPQAVASTLGVREQPGRLLVETLLDYLRAKTLLLMLDNCEHLIEACAQLATTLLRACTRLRIVASSREALGVAGETAYRVPSLSLPDTQRATPDALQHSEAARLFGERALAAQPRFGITSANAPAIAQICRRLDGIPLALELAAARVKLFSAEQIANRLDDSFRLLTGGSRTALPRQQTLRALIDWSYDLLPEPERAALRRFAVFAGGWTFEAAEAVIGAEALDLLSHLVDKSLVVAEEHAQAGETRYRLLETIRQYARDKLLESGESIQVRDHHLNYCLHLAAEAEPELEGLDMLRWLDRLETEHDNFRAALEWALERNPTAAVQLAASLTAFWQIRGYMTEGRRWLRDALTRFEALPPAAGEAARGQSALRATGLLVAGTLAFGQGELNAARSLLEESVALARMAGEQRTLGYALGQLGFTTLGLGDAAVAEAVLEESLGLFRAINDKRGIGLILYGQAERAIRLRGDFAAARAYSEEAVRLMRESGSPWLAAMSILGLGVMASYQGNYAEARAHFEEGEPLFRDLGDRHAVHVVQSERAHMERKLGHYAQAVALYSRTILGWQELGHWAALAHELECFAFIACAQSQAQRAVRLLGAAEALRESVNSPMTAIERTEYDHNVSALRAQMDEAAFTAAWAAGRALTMDEAVALATGTGTS